jgi:uncharacterized protein with HEPN domain
MIDMRDYALEAAGFVAGRTSADIVSDSMFCRALERSLFIVGEAANRVPRDVQARFPEIPWVAIIGLRNILAHGYETISPERLWQTATVSVPEMLKHLDEAIEKQPPFEV